MLPLPRRRRSLLGVIPAALGLILLDLAFGGLQAIAQTPRAFSPSASKSATSEPPGFPTLTIRVAFPNLSFERPVALAFPGGESELAFIVEQHTARIWSFPWVGTTTDKQLFLELPSPIHRGNEEGLLGLAFHPRYPENGTFYVYYSADDQGSRRSVVSRFRVAPNNPRQADPESEERIWVSAEDPFDNHNGGTIAFGPDGYLYISLGDGGAADDPLSTGQNPRDHFGSLLRIDVDRPAAGKPYGIPPDNPARRSRAHAHWAPEVYCIGLRNVWKFSFDRKTGDLWAGDVGQNEWEMVHRIENGGNYGWSIREGFRPFQPFRRQRPDRAGKIQPPIAVYPHVPLRNRKDFGLSITGGYVYRGQAIPELEGVYVYGDFETGRIWGLRWEPGKPPQTSELIDLRREPKLNIASFAEDRRGELYLLAFDGQIYELALRKR